MAFSNSDKSKILKLKSSIASYYNLQMKKLGDKKLESLFFEHCIITGGSISCLAYDETVADIDLYAKTAKGLTEIESYIITHMPKDQIARFDKYTLDDEGAKMVTVKDGEYAITNNAITLTNSVQFITLGEAEDCRKKFDFIHCMPWFDIASQKLHISEDQFGCIKLKKLKRNPLYSGQFAKRRVDKYVKRGWGFYDMQEQQGIIAQEISQIFPDMVQLP